MKLELKCLAAYLPYGLKGAEYNGAYLYELQSVSFEKFSWKPVYVKGAGFRLPERIDCKPILRPLSDLTKEELIEQGFWHHIDFLTHEKQNPIEAPYFMVEYLLSKHFDVFGLIEAGLAIDINTL